VRRLTIEKNRPTSSSPTTTEQVPPSCGFCNEFDVPFLARGPAPALLAVPAVAAGVMIALTRMKRVHEITFATVRHRRGRRS